MNSYQKFIWTLGLILSLNAEAKLTLPNPTSPDPIGNYSIDLPGVPFDMVTIPDVNGDARRDFVVAMRNNNLVQIRSGRNGQVIRTIIAPQGYINMGEAVADAGNINGFAAILVSAQYIDGDGQLRGLGFVFATNTGNLIYTLDDPTLLAADRLGHDVASGKDMTGDGVNDFVLALRNFSGPNRKSGAVIFDGQTGLKRCEKIVMPANDLYPQAETTLDLMDDFNGDNRADVIIGTSATHSPLIIDRNCSSLKSVIGIQTQSGSGFGYVVTALPDIDGDQRSDLLIKSRIESVIGSVYNTESPMLVIGSKINGGFGTQFQLLDMILSPEYTGASFGEITDSVRAADVNGDGFPDYIIGARSANQVGKVFIFNGKNPREVLMTFEGTITGESFGDVIAAGDLNGNGKADLIIGRFGGNTIDIIFN